MKIINLILAAAVLAGSPCAYSQMSKEKMKERSEYTKMTREQLNKKASKIAREEAKRLKKEGWQAAPGALPLELQLDRSYIMMSEIDSDYMPKFFTAEQMSVATSFDAAKMQALELAKQNLAGQIQTEATALVENAVANKQLEPGEAESLTKTLMSGKTLSSQTLGRIIPVVECYRTLDDGNKEVLVRIFYSADTARKLARKAALGDLEAEVDNLGK